MRSMETKWQRLGDLARGTETVSRDLEVILKVWRLGGHFCGAYGASAPFPSLYAPLTLLFLVIINTNISILNRKSMKGSGKL